MNTSFSNRVEKVNLHGGIIGWFISSDYKAINDRVQQLNFEGWKVVQVIPDNSSNLLKIFLKLLLLICTLFLYTIENGYIIIFQRSEVSEITSYSEKLPTAAINHSCCIKCSYENNPDDLFCQNCGNKLK